jgi:hypothetical protein
MRCESCCRTATEGFCLSPRRDGQREVPPSAIVRPRKLRCPPVKEREKTPALLHRQQPPTVSAATISSPVHRAGESGIEVTRMHATFRSARGSKCAMGNCTPYADLLFRAVSRSAPTRFTCRRPIWLCWIWQESWQPLGPVPVSAGPAEVSFAFADENVLTRAAASYSSLVLY